MRRGHHGVGGWRNENQRHFRPRGGGAPHFRPPRGYRMIDAPRFPTSSSRSLLANPHYPGPSDEHIPQSHDRSNYHPGQHNNQRHDRGHRGKRILPFIQRMMHGEDSNKSYEQQNMQNYYEAQSNHHVMYNSMGDVDHRHLSDIDERQMQPTPWSHPPPQFHDKFQKRRTYDTGDQIKLPVSDYSGHRPPASDHYAGNTGSEPDDSNAFNRSINDTVDIVRKRLIDREANPEPMISPTPQIDVQNQPSSMPPEQPVKKKTPKQRQIAKSNCDKIKDKIVHQLFKMDKDKIHKLMDNPSSSSKFEYAISSLVTESQNSFNRHLRSVAEKSLNCSSEFIHHDNNTIYEDTFMKQMQCILEPQDTVLLEDIKPMVLAELCKVLQLNDYDQFGEDQSCFVREDRHNELTNFDNNEQHPDAYDNYTEFDSFNTPQDNFYSQNQGNDPYEGSHNQEFESMLPPLYERRKPRKHNFDGGGGEYQGQSVGSKRIDRHSIETQNRSNDSKISGGIIRESPTHSDDTFSFNDDPFADNNIEENERNNHSIKQEQRCSDKIKQNTPLPTFQRSIDTLRFEDDTTTHSTEERHSFDIEKRVDDTMLKDDKSASPSLLSAENDSFTKHSADIEQTRRERKSIEAEKRVNDAKITNDIFKRSATPLPLFTSTSDTLTYDEDPFAELDRQYHVAVDHNFIESDDFGTSLSALPSEQYITATSKGMSKTPIPHRQSNRDSKRHEVIKSQKIDKTNPSKDNIKKEIDVTLKTIADSSLKFTSPVKDTIKEHKTNDEVKQELLLSDSDGSISSVKLIKSSGKPENKQHNSEVCKQQRLEESAVNVNEKSETSIIMNTSVMLENSSRKRSHDQKSSSHRKEKRKKSESSQPETNKQILNKNIIINVNDCAGKSSDKCESSKSIFNLFFSKEKSSQEPSSDIKKTDVTEKIDKHGKKKETPKKKDHENDVKKKHESNFHSNPVISPTDGKADAKTKLKPIDMFGELPRKPGNVHQAHRNTAVAVVSIPKTNVEVKKPLINIGRKQIRKHVATQVLRKIAHKEIQTDVSKSTCTRFIQTERKKLITRAAQTDPVVFKIGGNTKSTDAFERMKEIDMEIQVLLQEKFKLYSSIEMKESCSRTMESLGMAVLNMPVDEQKEVDGISNHETENENEAADNITEGAAAESALVDESNEDSIVEDFTNIPVEELEQIAFETLAVDELSKQKSARLRPLSTERKQPKSPTVRGRGKRKVTTPNISLIEQIITDDRPLEEIISLDDLEAPISKTKKKGQKSQVKPKNTKSKNKKVKSKHLLYDIEDNIRDCRVVLIREDLNKYLKRKPQVSLVPEQRKTKAVVREKCESRSASDTASVVQNRDTTVEPHEDTVESDIQFDMLDVSEDIVIGDVCEIKSNDKDTSNESVSEEIILDNSQSSVEETALSSKSSECRVYDFSSDENLQRDTIVVTGNGDAVLALECIGKDFIAACLDGNVYHFGSEGQLKNTLRGSNLAVTCVTIVKEKYGITIYTGSLDSRIRYYDLETGLEKGPECNVLSPIQTMDRAWDTVFVGTRTGFVLQFECKNNMLIPVSTVKFSEQSILALRALKEGPRKVLLVAARSEPVTIKDAQTGLLLRTLEGPKMTVYTLLFEDGKVYCGTSSHQIHVFDYASGTHVGSHEGGKGAVCLRERGGLVFAGCYDGCVYVFREGDARPLAQLRGPSLMLLSIAIVGTKIIAGYKDRSLYIWKIPLGVLQEMIL